MIDTTGCTITLYSQTNCRDSRSVREWMTSEHISFGERDVSRDEAAAFELANTGIFATPLVTICGQVVFGNQPDSIRTTIETCDRRNSS